MKLHAPFVQLPVRFDAARLWEEVSAFSEADWRQHPQGYAGNSALPLICAGGDPDDDGFIGPMRPTPYLERCPYLTRALVSLGAVWGRVRLMRLAGQAEVEPHVDMEYYWRERVRVHVPILTQPSVRFICGQDEVNMAAGECWIFDTWRLHRVINAASAQRIHLVGDTIGSETFWPLAASGRMLPFDMPPAGWAPRLIEHTSAPSATSDLRLESHNLPTVMSPWELRQHVSFLLTEAQPHPKLAAAQALALSFVARWHALWVEYGDSQAAWPAYRAARDQFGQEFVRAAHEVRLRNTMSLGGGMMTMVVKAALNDPASVSEQRVLVNLTNTEHRYVRGGGAGPDPLFDRPVFIVSPPRSGSTLLFETLSGARDVLTIGDESHGLIEAIQPLHPVSRGYESNRLGADAVTDPIALGLRGAFRSALRDRDGKSPALGRARMLEKTPKNALRVPFLLRVFPEAHFIYLYRDPREVLASMMEAWTSGRFRTYPQLPGWQGSPWSLLLTPGWRALSGKPLHEVVAAQWQATTSILLDDLGRLPADRVHIARYDRLVADPAQEVGRLCSELSLGWDRPFATTLPVARYTVSRPEFGKWRRYEAQIESALAGLAPTLERAANRALAA